MELSYLALREQICDICHKMWQLGWVAANDGNISAKLEDGSFMATPTGISKSFITPEKLGASRVLSYVLMPIDNEDRAEGYDLRIHGHGTPCGRNRAACGLLHVVGADPGRVLLTPYSAALDTGTIGGRLKLAELY